MFLVDLKGRDSIGNIDDLATKYFSDPRRFASVFEFAFKDKGLKITPNNLQPLDPREIIVGTKQVGNQTRASATKTVRDIMKMLTVGDEGIVFHMMLGLEEQSYVDYRMPVRVANYDLRRYWEQLIDRMLELDRLSDAHEISLKGSEFFSKFLKTDRIVPVVTVVLYLGSDPWDGPRTLHDMFDIQNPDYLSLVNDYDIHLIDPHDMSSEELANLPEDLSALFDTVASAADKERARNAFSKDARYHKVDTATAEMISALLGISLPKNEDGVTDVDNGFLQVIREEVNEGRAKVCEEILATYGDKLPPEVAEGILAMAHGERPQPADAPQAVTRS